MTKRIISFSFQTQKSEKQLEEWTVVARSMKAAVDTYESKVSPHLEEVEKQSAEPWKDALKLMKEE